MPKSTLTLEQRFWIKVDKSGPVSGKAPHLGACWLWMAAVSPKGYGWFRTPERPVMAHRMSYELSVGPIPDGTEVDHLCSVRNCVNPEHLEPVDHATNVRRGDGGPGKFPRTHCRNGHEYDEDNTRITADGTGRRCRVCAAAHARRWRRRKADEPCQKSENLESSRQTASLAG